MDIKKKKRIIAVLLTVLLAVVLIRSGAFGDTYIIDSPISVSDLTQNEQTYNALSSTINAKWGITMPSWENVGEFTNNIASAFVSQYVNCTAPVLADILNTLDSADLFNEVFFNNDSGQFEVSSSGRTAITDGVNAHIYVTPSSGIGNWVALPTQMTYGGRTYDCYNGNCTCYMTCVDYGSGNNRYRLFVAHYGDYVSGENALLRYFQSVNCNTYYNGTVDYGYYFTTAAPIIFSINGQSVLYSTEEAALADFFGHNTEPILTDANIVNANPTYTPISLPSVLGYNYTGKISENYGNGVTTPISPTIYNYYPYENNYNNLYWEDPMYNEFPNLEFPSVEISTIEPVTELDEQIEELDGSWIVEYLGVALTCVIVGLIL